MPGFALRPLRSIFNAEFAENVRRGHGEKSVRKFFQKYLAALSSRVYDVEAFPMA
jgi:hypothetical protein